MTTCVYCGGLLALEPNETSTETRCKCEYPTARVETVKTPPPLTPKDSLSVEVEEARFSEGMEKEAKVIRARAWFTDENFGYDRWKADSFAMGKGTHDCYIVMKDELLETYHKVKILEAQLRRKDEALEKLHLSVREHHAYRHKYDVHYHNSALSGWTNEALKNATAALADGKEGDQKKELEACQWCKKLVPHLIQITDKPDLHDARICEDCYSKEFPEVDGKEGGR